PVHELLDRRLELGDLLPPAVLGDVDLFVERRGDDRAQVARALRPAPRIAGLAGAERNPTRPPASDGCLFRFLWRCVGGVVFAWVIHVHAFLFFRPRDCVAAGVAALPPPLWGPCGGGPGWGSRRPLKFGLHNAGHIRKRPPDPPP